MNSTIVRGQHGSRTNSTTVSPSNTTFSNGPIEGAWTFTPSFTLFTIIAGTLANLTVLRLFTKRSTLRTPFGMYLINLLVANTIMSCILEPLNLVLHYYSAWTLGYHACVFRQYLGWTILDTIIFSHFLIAVNRLWAVVFPVSYRMQHTVKVAVVICATSWVIINACFIPTVVTITYVTVPDANGRQRCSLNTDPIGIWGPILQIVFYDAPIGLVFLLYPVICYKSFFGTRKHRQVRAGNDSSFGKARLATNQASTKSVGELMGGAGPAVHVATSSVAPSNRSEQPKVGLRWCCGKPRYGSASGFVTLTLMTLSVLVCLAPNEAYFTLLLVVDTDPPGLFEVVKVLQSLTIIFDPLLIVLANPELRNLLKKFFRL